MECVEKNIGLRYIVQFSKVLFIFYSYQGVYNSKPDQPAVLLLPQTPEPPVQLLDSKEWAEWLNTL